jgi:hypothetical protein
LPDLAAMDALFITFENAIMSGKGAVHIDDIEFRGRGRDDRQPGLAGRSNADNFLGGGFQTRQTHAGAISGGFHEDADSPAGPSGTVMRISYGGTIGFDYGGGRFSYALWETDLYGFDAQGYDRLVLTVRGHKGGEKPNVYLDDGVTRRCIRASEFGAWTSSWRKLSLPLARFASQGIDLSHLEALQLAFEWEEMSGTLYVAEIGFEQSGGGRNVSGWGAAGDSQAR